MSQLQLLGQPGKSPERIVEDALAADGGDRVVRRVCLISGGDDSTTVAHRCRDLYDELAFIDTGTALPGVRAFVEEYAARLEKPLRVYESGDAYEELVLGDSAWWAFFARERRPGETLSQFVIRTTPLRTRTDGFGNAPQGFPGPGRGGHRAAYARLKERRVEELVRLKKTIYGRSAVVALLTGARRHESRRRSMTQGVDGHRRKGGQLWINPLNEWSDEQVTAYRREHAIPRSDVSALMHRSGECNCGAYMAVGELGDVLAIFPDWHRRVIVPLQEQARAYEIPRCVWGERTDTGRPGARGYDFAGTYEAQLRMFGVDVTAPAGALCSSCAVVHDDLL